MLDFELNSELPVTDLFCNLGIRSFSGAMDFVKKLPYGRNAGREDFSLVLKEKKGTCSSKHALLKSLADENGHSEIKLMLGIFKMNGINTPKVSKTLQRYGLKYIPEAHTYLRIDKNIYDCTTENSSETGFVNDLMEEIKIKAEDVISRKLEIHHKFLKNWCEQFNYNPEEIWAIREECISDLSSI